MGDARRRLGADLAVQGDVPPENVSRRKKGSRAQLTTVLTKEGKTARILNLGHGVMGTPVESVARFLNTTGLIPYIK